MCIITTLKYQIHNYSLFIKLKLDKVHDWLNVMRQLDAYSMSHAEKACNASLIDHGASEIKWIIRNEK